MYEGEERRAALPFRLSREISIADIIGIIGLGLPLIILLVRMDSRVEVLERAKVVMEQVDAKHDQDRASLRMEIKTDLLEINRKLDRLIENGYQVRK